MDDRPILPSIKTLDEYRPLYRDASVWLPALRVICQKHSLDPTTLDFAPPGSNVVFWVEGNRLVKLFPPIFAEDCEREALVLRALETQADIDAPRVLYSGEVGGWPYLVLSRLEGVSLDEIWPELDAAGRERIASGLGRVMAALHRTPTAGLLSLGTDWAGFIRTQRETLLERQRAAGMSPAWLDDIAAYYADMPALVDPDEPLVLINADLNPEHIFCRPQKGGWEVSGMIDFGDAVLGDPWYEFVCPAFIFAGQPSLHRAMLLAYGLDLASLNEALSRRLTAYILLHRFIDAAQFPDLFPQHSPASMRELEQIAWSF